MERIGAGIVSFNPDLNRLQENIQSIKSQVNEILIVDNGSENISQLKELCVKENVQLTELGENKGIAFALNVICQYFFDARYEWVLTLDQDSVSPNNLIAELSEHISDKVGVIGPKIVYRNNEKFTKESICEIEEVEWIITSASLTNLNAWKKINGFDNKLFIDGVDKDLCIRMAMNGYKILVCNTVQLMHELGNLKCRKIFGRTIYVTNHSPFRVYYMSRNYFYLDKKFGTNSAKRKILKLLLKILAFEKRKIEKIKNIMRGINDSKQL